jgi:hypothetical protein
VHSVAEVDERKNYAVCRAGFPICDYISNPNDCAQSHSRYMTSIGTGLFQMENCSWY